MQILCTTLLQFAFDLCGKCQNTVLWCFLPDVPQFGAFFCLNYERAALSPGVRLLCRKMALKKDGTLSGIVAHLQGRWHTFRRTFVMMAHLRERRHSFWIVVH